MSIVYLLQHIFGKVLKLHISLSFYKKWHNNGHDHKTFLSYPKKH